MIIIGKRHLFEDLINQTYNSSMIVVYYNGVLSLCINNIKDDEHFNTGVI